MQNNRSLLHTLAITIIIAGASISCSGTKMPLQDQTSQLNSIHDRSSQFLITDAENDATSITFYSCDRRKQTEQQLQSPVNHPQNCVNAYKTADGKPFTVSKKSLQTEKIRNFLLQNKHQLQNLYQVTLKDLNIQKNNGLKHFTIGSIGTVSGIIAMTKLSHIAPINMISGYITIFSIALMGYGIGHGKKADDAIHRYDKYKTSLTETTDEETLEKIQSALTGSKDIDFETLTKELKQTDSKEYAFFKNIIDALGSDQNEFQDTISINSIFYQNFAKYLEKLNLSKPNEITEYCQILPTKTCYSL